MLTDASAAGGCGNANDDGNVIIAVIPQRVSWWPPPAVLDQALQATVYVSSVSARHCRFPRSPLLAWTTPIETHAIQA